MLVSDCIKNIRFNLGYSQTKLAKEIDIDKTSISLYESGKRKPGFSTLRKIINLANSNGMNITYDDIRDDL